MKPISAIAALSIVGLLACEPVLQPEVNSPDFANGGGARKVLRSVTGSGHFTTASGELRTFSFSAREHADGTVKGEFQGLNRAIDVRAHGDITCFTIVGNTAWIGGSIEQFPSDPSSVGLDAFWQVVDNGQGANAAPDQISRASVLAPGGAAIQCANTPNLGLNNVEAGNIHVRP